MLPRLECGRNKRRVGQAAGRPRRPTIHVVQKMVGRRLLPELVPPYASDSKLNRGLVHTEAQARIPVTAYLRQSPMVLHETPQTVPDVACMLCGCVCDDLAVTTHQGRVVAAMPRCSIAEPWFLRQSTYSDAVTARVAGKSVDIAVAVATAAEILRSARAPLIYGLSRSSTPGQRSAVRLAEELGATIDTTASTCHAPSIMAVQAVGESTATLGEVKNRSDLVVYWGSDPLVSHPRHLERIVDAPGMFVPGGRRDRHLIVVDVTETETAHCADTFVQVAAGSDFDLLWALRAAVRGVEIARVPYGDVPWPLVQQLAERLRSCRYGAVFFGLGLTRHGIAHANVEALLRLVTDLNAHTRFVARRMRIPGDVAGADSVLCWHTGYPFSVNLAARLPPLQSRRIHRQSAARAIGSGCRAAGRQRRRGETDAGCPADAREHSVDRTRLPRHRVFLAADSTVHDRHLWNPSGRNGLSYG